MKLRVNSLIITRIFCILVAFMLVNCAPAVKDNQESPRFSEDGWECGDTIDRALLRIVVNNQSEPKIDYLDVRYQNNICSNCDYLPLISIVYYKNATEASTLDSYYEYKFQVTYFDSQTNSTAVYCDRFDFNDFGECGEYVLQINSMNDCNIQTLKNPKSSHHVLLIALGICVLLFIISNLVEYFHLVEKLLNICEKKTREDKSKGSKDEKGSDQEIEHLNQNPDKIERLSDPKVERKTESRLRSLDTFRGISLTIMIVANYGAGGYKFLNHVPWHGLTIADMVFPWFIWIMGLSVVLSTNILLQKSDSKKWDIFKKIALRSVKMFLIGIILNSIGGTKLDELRIFNVLQRISICYFLVATIELVFHRGNNSDSEVPEKKWTYYLMDIIWPWKQWIIMSIIFTSWFLITYLLDVPGCGRGYLGPGGMDGYGKYANCSGGAMGYIDTLILGPKMQYKAPTHLQVFHTDQLIEPEGVLGTFNAIILTFLGVQAGRILVLYKSNRIRLIKWGFWAIVNFGLFLALTHGDMHNGFIPVNKNLWTPTYTFFTASTAFTLMIIFYILIDLKKLWSGNPFIYPGMNSILIYIFHEVFQRYLPCSFIVANTHGAQLAMAIWGAIFWILVSMYLFHKRIFFNL